MRAVGPARAFVLQASDLKLLIHHHPSILMAISRELATRLGVANSGGGQAAEDISDQALLKRHEKLEKDEKQRKR